MSVSKYDIMTGTGADTDEYCQLETFSARCRHGDVVVMTTARFGRMRVGRCIDASSRSAALEKALQSDSNLLGCYADVLDYADRTCSGKTSCEIFVPNRDLLSTRPCVAQLTMYFEAAYQCVPGKLHASFFIYLCSFNHLVPTCFKHFILLVFYKQKCFIHRV